jgi:hypothetical protein
MLEERLQSHVSSYFEDAKLYRARECDGSDSSPKNVGCREREHGEAHLPLHTAGKWDGFQQMGFQTLMSAPDDFQSPPAAF